MGKNILIIDDDPEISELLETFLRQNGSDVVLESNAEKGLAQARKNEFDIILLDIMLPDSTGVDALRNMHKVAPQTPIIMITGGNDLDLAKECLKLGAADYITKPFDFEYLHTTVIANMLG